MWSLYDEKGDALKPLVFSNGKGQDDVVKEVVSAIKEGVKVIFIKGVCGTGKSAIALNIAKELGRASVVVPIKSLQKQYEDDYTNKKYLLKENGEKLRIKVLTGRANHECPFIKETGEKFYKSDSKEADSKLSDFAIMLNKLIERKNTEKMGKRKDLSCDNPFLPCRIEIAEKNAQRIREYIKKNPKIKFKDFDSIHRVKRMSIAPICPYWSPIIPSDIDLDIEGKARKYLGLLKREYIFHQRKQGCGYYDQFNSYIDADVLIFNSEKYKLEVVMNRKPLTDVEIIDECDEFLDSFANTKKINLNKLYMALGYLYSDKERVFNLINKLIELVAEIIKDKKVNECLMNGEIIQVKETKIFELLRNFLDSNFMDEVECDEENYCYHCDETARTFEGFFDETYISFDREEKDIIVKLVTTNLEKRFQELLNKSKAIVMMSGTIHSEQVLKDVFGLKDFRIIEAETKMPGTITKVRTGLEFNCNYSMMQLPPTRKRFLKAFEKCVEGAKKPLLINVTAFKDLPTKMEAEENNLRITSKEELTEKQKKDKTGHAIKDFKDGKMDVLYSTKCNRGVDFPGETCNSIILTRYPYPNVKSIFWKILKKTKPEYYDEFYRDKSRREFLQRIYRGLRSQDDHIFLLSPDIRVINAELD